MTSKIRQAFIIAGGMGTRLAHAYPKPKLLVEIGGKSNAERLIEELVSAGIEDLVFLLGHNAQIIVKHLSEIKGNFPISVNILRENTPLGTGGALIGAREYMQEHFLVVYGDLLICNVLKNFVASFNPEQSDASIVVRPTNHPFDSDIVEVTDSIVTKIYPKPHKHPLGCRPLGNAGLYIFSRGLFDDCNSKKLDLDKNLLPIWIEIGSRIHAHFTGGIVRDFGTPQRLREVVEESAILKQDSTRRKAIFLDRDDTLIADQGDFTNLKEPKIFSDAFIFLQSATRQGYLIFVLTNQPSIAKGFVSIDETLSFHANIEWSFAKSNAPIQEILFCPHHPEAGHLGENPQYKFSCNCRKPKRGMVEKAISEYEIDLTSSILIGDSWRDEKLAAEFNLRFYLIKRNCIGGSYCSHIHLLSDVLDELK
jgi:D,D-heptose 1,7-bisphosphate phosphatase